MKNVVVGLNSLKSYIGSKNVTPAVFSKILSRLIKKPSESKPYKLFCKVCNFDGSFTELSAKNFITSRTIEFGLSNENQTKHQLGFILASIKKYTPEN
jgi:hypothetical protein